MLRMPIYAGRRPERPQVQEPIVIVKVERIRRGRRLPDVEYVEARSPRRQAERQDFNGFRGKRSSAELIEPVAGLRLPWRIKERSE